MRESSETASVCQNPMSFSTGKGTDCEEKVVRRSGRDCCIICQKLVVKATMRAKAGAWKILFTKSGMGWYTARRRSSERRNT